MDKNIIKKDTLLIVTSGEYSDYTFETALLANKRVDIEKLRRRYCAYSKNLDPSVTNSIKGSINRVVNIDKTMTECSYREWFLGSCSLRIGYPYDDQ